MFHAKRSAIAKDATEVERSSGSTIPLADVTSSAPSLSLDISLAGRSVLQHFSSVCALVNQMLHTTRRAKALGYGYEARLRGLKLCDILLTNIFPRFVG
jgi:hypothetical protein